LPSTWSSILEELKEESKRETPGGRASWAKLLLRKIKRVVDQTGRPLILYGSACTTPKRTTGRQLSIDIADKLGFHEMTERIDGPNVDVVVHSPGGSAEAVETIVEALRRKYSSVRYIIPAYAKSAATMMTMSGDQILMDIDAELGPIDPQMLLPNGVSPAEAVKEQFQKASQEILADQRKITVWMPILQPMGPSLLVQCDYAIELSRRLVREWLEKYMFKGDADGPVRAAAVAEYLGTASNFASHGRRVKLDQLQDPARNFRLNLVNLRDEPMLYQAIWEVYCVMDVIFSNTPVYKLFYNSVDDAMVRMEADVIVQQVAAPAVPQMKQLPKI
jgi:hypothetical protein